MDELVFALFVLGVSGVAGGIVYMLGESAWDGWRHHDRPMSVIKAGGALLVVAVATFLLFGIYYIGTGQVS